MLQNPYVAKQQGDLGSQWPPYPTRDLSLEKGGSELVTQGNGAVFLCSFSSFRVTVHGKIHPGCLTASLHSSNKWIVLFFSSYDHIGGIFLI